MITNHAQFAKILPIWLYKIGAQLWMDNKYPRHLFLETTAACNLTCEYCPREKIKDHMDFELFTRIIDEANNYGPRSFSLHLFGEPLLYPKWFEAIKYIKEKNSKNTVLLTTNGTLLNKLADRVIEANPDKILWSWRKESKFTKETKEKLRKWRKFCVRFIDELTPKEAIYEWKDWPLVEGRSLHNYGGEIDLQKFGVQNTDGKRWACYHLWLAPAVSWNGEVLMCCADPHKKEILGKFPDQSISEIWQGKRIKDIRESHLGREFSGICSKCDVWKQYPDLFFSWQYTGPSSFGGLSKTPISFALQS